MKYAFIMLMFLLSVTVMAQFGLDPSDPALSEPPPLGGNRICSKPVLIEEPCKIYIDGVQNGKPVITIAASMKKPVPVTYTTHSDDTAVYIILKVIRSQHIPRFQPRILLPGDTFPVYVGYEDAPGEQGVFTVTRVGDGWIIQAVEETGFIRLGKSSGVAAKPRKE